ncbi:hypothetical protein GCQ56_04300 [Marinifilum sp. N1E240]|uniref:DUF6265 family protein n=1 Tax=Marinifilum sp. N1E240 TaxID=2608082 RepID=UPI00128D28FE|nr:DUF6265 family protein [Marinifilum sp. N1E240]MPQ46224.1 hypothetical protein [Marinifilum sp. N1E240]
MKNLAILILSIITTSCSTSKIEKLEFLEGTWQIEGKEQFEVWEQNGEELKGYGYNIKENHKQISETLAIKMVNGKVVYQATVANQNEGATVSFQLNDTINDYYSFENAKHDFPNKIQYYKLSENKVKVKVLGDENKGFSFEMNRVE